MGRGFASGLPCQAPSEGDQPFASSPFAHPIPQSHRRASEDLFSASLAQINLRRLISVACHPGDVPYFLFRIPGLHLLVNRSACKYWRRFATPFGARNRAIYWRCRLRQAFAGGWQVLSAYEEAVLRPAPQEAGEIAATVPGEVPEFCLLLKLPCPRSVS